MSASEARTYARRAKNTSDPEQRTDLLVKAIEQLARAIEYLTIEVEQLKRQ
jgi:hypothetical protein